MLKVFFKIFKLKKKGTQWKKLSLEGAQIIGYLFFKEKLKSSLFQGFNYYAINVYLLEKTENIDKQNLTKECKKIRYNNRKI